MNNEERASYRKIYYLKNREKISKQQSEYRKFHKKRMKEQEERYNNLYAHNSQKLCAYCKHYGPYCYEKNICIECKSEKRKKNFKDGRKEIE